VLNEYDTKLRRKTVRDVSTIYELYFSIWICDSFDSSRTDRDFCHQGRGTEIAQKNEVRQKILTWPFIGKLFRSTFWWYMYGGVTSFHGGTVFVVHLFWHNNSFILIKSRGILQGI
jgi:hypothetical protein